MTVAHPAVHIFATPEELADELSDRIAQLLNRALVRRNRACLVVSGGSTPGPLFSRLSEQDINWAQVTITLADERWVENTHPASNERLVRDLLLQNRARDAAFVPLKNKEATAREGEDACHHALSGLPRPFDIVLLGMGSDGHTASFFTGSGRLNEALDMNSGRNCVAIMPADAPLERMTLSLPALLETRQIILHITGLEKRRVLDLALAGGPTAEMPVRAILKQKLAPVDIYWAP